MMESRGPLNAYPQLRSEGGPSARAKWTFGALLSLTVALLLCALALSNVTAEGPAERTLGRSLAILTEVDRLLDREYADLRARASATTGPVVLTDFPVGVLFAPDDVLAGDQGSFRDELLRRAAERLHEDGAAVLREDRDDDPSLFSAANALRRGVDMLRPAPHRIVAGLTVALAIAAFLLALGLALATRGYGRMLAVGLSVFFGAIPFLAAAVAVRFAFRVAADGADDYLSQQFLELAQELAWAAIRNGMVFSIGAAVVVVASALLARWEDTRALT